MFVSFRTALLVLASLASSSVAPAQMLPVVPVSLALSVPLVSSNQFSRAITPISIEALPEAQPLLSDSLSKAPSDSDNGDEIKAIPGETLAAMVSRLKSATASSREIECLAGAIYFESKSEPLTGQLAVGKVIANRAASRGRFPPTYCGVLFQRGQFSFVHGSSLPSVPRSSRQWHTAVAVAKIVDQGLKESAVGNALFFHARYVSPNWRLKRVAMIGNHIFYR